MLDGQEYEVILEGFTVYERPKDFPDYYVVRRWWTLRGVTVPVNERAATYHATLEQARAAIPEGKVCIGRQHGDDPVILEVWI